MKVRQLFSILVLISLRAFSADEEVQNLITTEMKYGFNIEYAEGSPLKITWPDGRQATSFKRSMKPMRLELPIDITENLCVRSSPKVKCTYKFDLKLEAIDMRWTKHPTSVGKILKASGYEFSRQSAWFVQLKYVAPVSTADLQTDELVCESWEWVPGGKKNETPATLKMSSLDGDINQLNLTTGVAVNQGFAGYYNLVWTKSNDGVLSLTGMGKYFSSLGTNVTPFIGFIMSANIENPYAQTAQEKYCQVTMRPDSSKLRAMFTDVLTQADPVEYTLGSDELFSALVINYDFAKAIFDLGYEQFDNGKTRFIEREVK